MNKRHLMLFLVLFLSGCNISNDSESIESNEVSISSESIIKNSSEIIDEKTVYVTNLKFEDRLMFACAFDIKDQLVDNEIIINIWYGYGYNEQFEANHNISLSFNNENLFYEYAFSDVTSKENSFTQFANKDGDFIVLPTRKQISIPAVDLLSFNCFNVLIDSYWNNEYKSENQTSFEINYEINDKMIHFLNNNGQEMNSSLFKEKFGFELF